MYCCAWCRYFKNAEKEGSDGYCFIDGTDVRCEDVCDEFKIQEGKRGNEMTNYEWLKSLNIEDMAKMIGDDTCEMCFYNEHTQQCKGQDCEEGIAKWLKEKREKPMPEIKAGDLLFYSKNSYYVAIAPDKLVTLRGYVVVDLENAIRNNSIIAVRRYINGEVITIWEG